MAHLDHVDHEPVVFNPVDDSTGTLPHTVLLPAGQLLTAGGTGILAQGLNPGDDQPSLFLLRNRFDLPNGRELDEEPISSHPP